MASDTVDSTPASRSPLQYAMFAAAAAAFLLVPAVIASLASRETTTVSLLIYLPLIAFGLGVADGAWFRFTWSFPIIAAAIFWLSTTLMYNPGTWIYAVGVLLLCALGTAAGDTITKTRRRS